MCVCVCVCPHAHVYVHVHVVCVCVCVGWGVCHVCKMHFVAACMRSMRNFVFSMSINRIEHRLNI